MATAPDTIVLDRSGSMASIKTDMDGGLNTFLEQQKSEPGECYVSLYQFDDKYEMVFENRAIKDVGEITLIPRGYTALLDGIGKTINAVGERLKNTLEADRPELVVICVITDGEENSSKEFTRDQIAKLVKQQTNTYNWRFVFLGANFDAVKAGTSMGFSAGSSMTYGANSKGARVMYSALGVHVSSVRSNPSSGCLFTDEQRVAAMGAPIQPPPIS